MAATKPQLSRQYVYAPLGSLNFDLSLSTYTKLALKSDPTVAPVDADWNDAIRVTSGHALYDATIGNALAILVGPARADVVTTLDLAAGSYLVWCDIKPPSSDERIVDWHGTLEITTAPGSFPS